MPSTSIAADVLALVNRVLRRLDLFLVRNSGYARLEAERNAVAKQSPYDLQFLQAVQSSRSLELLNLLTESRSQIRQDLFVLSALDFKRDGYFVEFGACEGIKTSNTVLLEQKFGWSGLLLEPAKVFHEKLVQNRTASIDFRCVWSASGARLPFMEQIDLPGRSTVSSLSVGEADADGQRVGIQYDVETVSLLDALDEHGAPRVIDYLSIDTEGSEFEILNAFDFSQYRFSVITCEHNYAPQRELIHELLTLKGYRRVHRDITQFDDWYVHAG